MSSNVDKVVIAARNFVDRLTPEERDAAELPLQMLVRAVEAAHLAEDEPIFCLRGQDCVAEKTIRAWATFAEQAGASLPFCDDARAAAESFHEWRERNPLKVKIPD